MLGLIKKRWKSLAGVLALSILTVIMTYVFEFFRKRVLSWFWTPAVRFIHLLIAYWDLLVPLVFGMLFAVVTAALYLKLHHAKKDILGRLARLEGYPDILFEDNFQEDLEKNWEYDGTWRILHRGELDVTHSDKGGITKIGQYWTNYSFEFTAVMVTTVGEYQCIGWIVRAQDLFNYCMIQLNPAEVRPHLRVRGRWITAPKKTHGYAIDSEKHDLSIKPKEPIEIRTEVRESEIRVYVNNREIYHDQKFFSMRFVNKKFEDVPRQPDVLEVLPFMTGRVGFRMAKEEYGKFSRCRVRTLPQGVH